MLRRQMSHPAIVAFLLSVSAAAGAQSAQPIVVEVLKTGSDSVTGVAEPASGRFIVYSTDSAIIIYNQQARKRTTVVVKRIAGALSISRSGGRLIFPVADEPSGVAYFWAMDLDTLSGAQRGEPHRVSVIPARHGNISPDGRWIALITPNKWSPSLTYGNRLLVTPSDGGNERLLDSAIFLTPPRWTPNGKSIFYGREQKLARISFAGGKPDSLGTGFSVFGVSPDGKYVGFFLPGRGHVLGDLNGKVLGSISALYADDRPSGFRGDGRSGLQILARRQLKPATLKTVSLETGSITPYGVTERFPVGARFSPDGSRLAMVTMVDGREQLVVYDIRSRKRRVLPTTEQPDHLLHWSPNGAYIAFLALNSAFDHLDLHVVDVASGRVTRLPDIFAGDWWNAAAMRTFAERYYWRSDSKALEFVTAMPGASPRDTGVKVQRVTLSGTRSIVRSIPRVEGWRSSFRSANDSLLLVTTATQMAVLAVPLPSGEPRTLFGPKAHGMFGMPYRENPISPDGKWVAFATGADTAGTPTWAIASIDGKTSRFVGSIMPCYAWAEQWLPDSRAFIGVGVSTCEPRNPEVFVVPIDGSPARHISLPPHQNTVSATGYQLTPDGKSLLVAVDDPRTGTIISIDVSRMIGPSKARSAGNP